VLPLHSSISFVLLYIGVQLAKQRHLTSSFMAECWGAFSINKNISSLTLASLDVFKDYLEKQIRESGPIVSRPSNKRERVQDTPPAKKRGVDQTHRVTPNVDVVKQLSSNNNIKDNTTSQVVRVSYNEREGAGKVIATYNPHNLASRSSSTTATTRPRCQIDYDFSTNVTQAYRHMYTTPEERSAALNDHLVELGNIMIEHFGLDKEPGDDDGNEDDMILEAVGVPRQGNVCCIGRICNSVRSLIGFVY
jgi:hypothetical protein